MAERDRAKRTRIKASSMTNTYVYCRIAAREALKRAENERDGALYSCMTAGVFASFTVEAYLNHLGQSRVQDWDAIERKLGPREKLARLREELKLSADESRRPFQTLQKMLRLRDALAHGKTVTEDVDRIVRKQPQDEVHWPEPEWKRLCALDKVKRFVEDAEAIVRNLSAQIGSSRDPFDCLGHVWCDTNEVE